MNSEINTIIENFLQNEKQREFSRDIAHAVYRLNF